MRYLYVLFLFVFSLTLSASDKSPYAGQQHRQIKSLSKQDISDLLEGNGMGLAKAAELNGYPGPAHVLELKGKLGLSKEQLLSTQNLFGKMKKNAMNIGKQIVHEEQRLDAQFSNKSVIEPMVKQSITKIARLQGELRITHLMAHLKQAKILSVEQIEQYYLLRGYAGNSGKTQEHAPGHKH